MLNNVGKKSVIFFSSFQKRHAHVRVRRRSGRGRGEDLRWGTMGMCSAIAMKLEFEREALAQLV